MTRDSENTLATELPTAGEVADILMKLVQFAGLMDRTAIEKKGQRLRPLPCVTGALEAHGLSEEDWPVAVIRAIECLVTSNGRYPGLNGKFLMRTFALDGHLGSLTSRMEDFVNEEPKWKGRDNTLKAQRSMMLTEFAGVMRSAPDYPCRNGRDPAVEKLAALLASALGKQRELHLENARSLQQSQNDLLELHRELSALAPQWGVEVSSEKVITLVLHLYAEAELVPVDTVNRLAVAQRIGAKRRIFGYSFLGSGSSGSIVVVEDPGNSGIGFLVDPSQTSKFDSVPVKKGLGIFDSPRRDSPFAKRGVSLALVRNPFELARILLAPKRSRDTVDETSLVLAGPV